MTGMTDQTFVDKLLTNIFGCSTDTTITGGTGGTTQVVTPPFILHLCSATGSETTQGTEQATGGGYTAGGTTFSDAGGKTLGSPFAGSVSGGQFSNANAVSWEATATWSPSSQTGIEIWDSAATAVRYLWGALTSNITGVGNGDTVTFAAGSIGVNASEW